MKTRFFPLMRGAGVIFPLNSEEALGIFEFGGRPTIFFFLFPALDLLEMMRLEIQCPCAFFHSPYSKRTVKKSFLS